MRKFHSIREQQNNPYVQEEINKMNQYKRITSDFSIVVQGPLNIRSLKMIEHYKQYGRVVLSYWSCDDERLLDGIDLSNCTVIRSEMPEKLFPKDNFGIMLPSPTIYWAAHSIYAGIRACTSELFVKIRSDEKFSDLEPMLSVIKDSPNKFTTSNIFFKPWSTHPFHVSDHIFGGSTEIFRKSFKYICDVYDGKLKYGDTCPPWMILSEGQFAESVFAKSFLNVLDKPIGNDCIRSVLDNFRLVTADSLGDYFISYAGAKTYWTNTDERVDNWSYNGTWDCRASQGSPYPMDSVATLNQVDTIGGRWWSHS